MNLKKLNNTVVSSADKWNQIRNHQDVKKISFLGILKDGKGKQEIILNDKSSIIVWF